MPATLILLLALLASEPEILECEGLRILHPPRLAGLAEEVADRLPALRRQVEADLGARPGGPLTVNLVPGDAAFREIVGDRAAHLAAVAYPSRAVIALKASALRRGPGISLPSLVRHELVHVVLHDRLGGRRLPRWFEEGLADLVGGAFPVASLEELPAAVSSGRLMDFDDLDGSFPDDPRDFALAYHQSEDFVRHLSSRIGMSGLRRTLNLVGEGRTLDAALGEVAGLSRAELERRWRDRLHRENPWWVVLLRTRWTQFLWFSASLLAIAAFVRYGLRRRRILKELDAEEDDAP